MNTLSRVDSYLFSLVSSHPPPAPAALSSIQPEPAPTFTFPTSNEPASKSSSVNVSPSPSPVPSNATVRRRFPTTSRRRRRRHPTSSSIKVPPPTTPLLLRVALAIWSILLSFWRSLVGDTRAVRVLRHKKRTVTVAAVPVGAGAAPDRLAESPAAASKGKPVLGLGHPAASPASSDESASEHEGWVDPVTRAPVDNGTPVDSDSEVEFGRPRVPETMSIQLQSSLRKSGLDSKLNTKQPKFVTTVTAPTPRRTPRLLPNPMQTSLLDPSVPAVPHRSVSPTNAPSVRPQHTPFHLQKTLILDLDETLIHSTSRPMGASHSGTGMLGLGSGLFGGKRRRREGHTIEVVLNGRSTTYHVYKRPYVDFFLKRVGCAYHLGS